MKHIVLLLFSVLFLFGKIADITSFSADFTQSVKSIEQKEILYKGKIYLKSPNLALWNYETPVKKQIYIRGEEIVTYEPLLDQAIFSRLERNLDFLEILKNAKEIGKNSYRSDIDGTIFNIKSNDKGIPLVIEYEDKLQNKITIALENAKPDTDIDNSIFMPDLPEHTDILRE